MRLSDKSRSDSIAEVLKLDSWPGYAYRSGRQVPRDLHIYRPHESARYVNWSEDSRDLLPELYVSREDCSGCSACASVCPVRAISMKPDEEGFLYPVIDASKCIGCYRCTRTCPLRIS